MIDDRDHRVLTGTAEQIRREDPELAALLAGEEGCAGDGRTTRDGCADHDGWATLRFPSGRRLTTVTVAALVLAVVFGLAVGSTSVLLVSFSALVVVGTVVHRRSERGRT